MAKKTIQKQVPSVGRVVHYIAYGTPGGEFPAGEKRAAIIAQVFMPQFPNPEAVVGLCVLNPNGFYFNDSVPFGTEPGCWCWPEFVPSITVELSVEDE